jgi:hypothetical protein
VDVSVRGGIQLENVRVLERNLQLLVEYFHGNSPDGQFYKRRIDYLGLGAHFHFSFPRGVGGAGGRAGAGGLCPRPPSRLAGVPNPGRGRFRRPLAGNGTDPPPPRRRPARWRDAAGLRPRPGRVSFPFRVFSSFFWFLRRFCLGVPAVRAGSGPCGGGCQR